MTMIRAPRFDRAFLPGIARNVAACLQHAVPAAAARTAHSDTIRGAVACYLLGSGDSLAPRDRLELEDRIRALLSGAGK